jgi:hypothetical protein
MTLRDARLILRPNFAPAHPGFGFAELVELLRTQDGGPMVDAALGAEGPAYAGSDPDPVAVMPVSASGADRFVRSVHLPGQEGSYVVFAASAPV